MGASPSPSRGGDVPGGMRKAACWEYNRMKNKNRKNQRSELEIKRSELEMTPYNI